MSVWTYAVLRLGFILFVDFATGRLDLLLSSAAELWTVNLGTACAVVFWSLPSAVVAAGIVVAVAGSAPDVTNPALLTAAIVASIVGVTSVGFLFSPIRLLTGGREGFFNAVIPFGVLVGGFLYPISLLPSWLEVIGRALPLSWAAIAANSAFNSRSTPNAWLDVIVSIMLSIAYVAVSIFLYRVVERRLRNRGQAW
jgi:ABC-2 type transport system permease protein